MKVSVTEGYRPGSIGRLTELHAAYYSRHWGFGLFFEAKVACDLAEFLSRFDPQHDGFWCLQQRGRIEGGIAIDGIAVKEKGAHLRWFIVSERLIGSGGGHQLIQQALTFCRAKSHKKVYLWTFKGLDAARHLYDTYGFHLDRETEGRQWGKRVIEQKFICRL